MSFPLLSNRRRNRRTLVQWQELKPPEIIVYSTLMDVRQGKELWEFTTRLALAGEVHYAPCPGGRPLALLPWQAELRHLAH